MAIKRAHDSLAYNLKAKIRAKTANAMQEQRKHPEVTRLNSGNSQETSESGGASELTARRAARDDNESANGQTVKPGAKRPINV